MPADIAADVCSRHLMPAAIIIASAEFMRCLRARYATANIILMSFRFYAATARHFPPCRHYY